MRLMEALVGHYNSIRLRDCARDILWMLSQNHQLTKDEELVLSILQGPYPDEEVARVAKIALDVLKENNFPLTSDEDQLAAG